jgi:hypothetical protein
LPEAHNPSGFEGFGFESRGAGVVTSLLLLSSTASNAVQDFFLSFVNQDADTRKKNQNVKRKHDIG